MIGVVASRWTAVVSDRMTGVKGAGPGVNQDPQHLSAATGRLAMSLLTATHAEHDDEMAWVIDIDPTQPTCKRRDCRHVPYARGLCHQCWTPKPRPRPKFNPADRLEDLRWMLDTGESPWRAAHRLGVSSHALARWLTRHQQHELARIFYGLDKQR